MDLYCARLQCKGLGLRPSRTKIPLLNFAIEHRVKTLFDAGMHTGVDPGQQDSEGTTALMLTMRPWFQTMCFSVRDGLYVGDPNMVLEELLLPLLNCLQGPREANHAIGKQESHGLSVFDFAVKRSDPSNVSKILQWPDRLSPVLKECAESHEGLTKPHVVQVKMKRPRGINNDETPRYDADLFLTATEILARRSGGKDMRESITPLEDALLRGDDAKLKIIDQYFPGSRYTHDNDGVASKASSDRLLGPKKRRTTGTFLTNARPLAWRPGVVPLSG